MFKKSPKIKSKNYPKKYNYKNKNYPKIQMFQKFKLS